MKSVIHLRKILPAVSWLVAASFLPGSCNKPSQAVNENVSSSPNASKSLRESAGTYFATIATKKVDSVATPKGNKKYVRVIKQQPVNRFAQISKTINWQDAFEEQVQGATYLFVPVKENIKPFANRDFEFFRYLVFSKDKQAAVTVSVIEVLSDKGYSFELPGRQIAVAAFKNKMETKTGIIGSVNASVLFFDNAYKQTSVFKLSNGAWGEGNIRFRSDLSIRQ